MSPRIIPSLRLLLCLTPLVLASCNVGVIDPTYHSLAGVAETNPPRDAITGMWHRHWNVTMGSAFRMSMLFRSDGTGLVDSVILDPLTGHRKIGDEMGPFRWQYTGKGVWTMTDGSGRSDVCRISQGKLLREYHSQAWHAKVQGRPGYYVYERVAP